MTQGKTATTTATEPRSAKNKRPAPKPVRGVYEHPVGSDVWWINYYIAGRRHREKVGARGKAVSLYQKRKSDGLAGIKLPDSLRVKKAVVFNDLATWNARPFLYQLGTIKLVLRGAFDGTRQEAYSRANCEPAAAG